MIESVLVVAPFVPALLLAISLLALTARRDQVAAAMDRRRQIGSIARPELTLAAVVLAVALCLIVMARALTA